MININNLRQKIDLVDKKLVELFEERMELSFDVGKYKKENNLPIFDEKREKEIINDRVKRLKNNCFENDLKLFFDFLMSISKKEQLNIVNEKNTNVLSDLNYNKVFIENPKLVFQGIEGSNSEEALSDFFKSFNKKISVNEFEDVFIKIANSEADFGILPIENSSTGSISDVFDLLNKYDCYIVGENLLKIKHCLLGQKSAKMEDIKEIYSHSQGLFQCSEFLSKFPDIHKIPYFNTAVSAKFVSESKDVSKAAIASERNAKLYNLKVINNNISKNENNYTRFVIVAKKPIINENCDKISIAFSLPHISGSLYRVLSYFANSGLNLVKIESRPVWNNSFEYLFFIDFSGNIFDENVICALNSVIKEAAYFKFLGNYKSYKVK